MGAVTRLQDIDATWLSQQLRAAGLLREANITGFTQRSVGNGLVGRNLRGSLLFGFGLSGLLV